jgi:hypothetical protein
MDLPPNEKDEPMQIRRFVTPLVATLLTAGLVGFAAGPVVSAPVAGHIVVHTNDTGWGRM